MLAKLLHQIAAMEQSEQESHDFYPRPSIAGPDRCIRQLVYWAKKTDPKPLPGRTLHVFDDGHWHEELVKDWIRKSAFQLHSEQMEIDTMVGVGHVDGIITDMLGVDRLWENKALNHFTFESIWNGNWPTDYLTQLALYIEGAGRINPELTEGILFIKNKNTAAYMELVCKYDREKDSLTITNVERSNGDTSEPKHVIPDICMTAVNKFAAVQHCVDDNMLPDRQYPFDDWHCGYCPYGQTCWEAFIDEHKNLAEHATLDTEMADMVRYERELQAHESEVKKERGEVRENIKKKLTELKARSGRAGEYLIDWKAEMVEQFNSELVPVDVRNACKETLLKETLKIVKIKGDGK